MGIISVNMFFVIKFLIFGLFLLTSVTCYNKTYIFEESKECNIIAKHYYDYDEFFALSDINDSQPAGYYAKIPISVISEYGTTYIILCETDAWQDKNNCYEFALGIWNNSRTEIRRKDSVHELLDYVKYEFVPYSYTVETNTKLFIEVSVSNDGVINLLDRNTQIEIYMKDRIDVIPVKYIAFASYQGHETSFTFNCSNVFHSEEMENSENQTDVGSRGFTLVSTWTMYYIITIVASCQLHKRMFNVLTQQ